MFIKLGLMGAGLCFVLEMVRKIVTFFPSNRWASMSYLPLQLFVMLIDELSMGIQLTPSVLGPQEHFRIVFVFIF